VHLEALIAAARDGNVKAVRGAVASGMVHAVQHQERPPYYTALHAAAEKGHVDVVGAVLFEGPALQGAKATLTDANARAGEKLTPLHLAARYGHARVVELLLKAGADVSAKDSSGQTPFDAARAKSTASAAIYSARLRR